MQYKKVKFQNVHRISYFLTYGSQCNNPNNFNKKFNNIFAFLSKGSRYYFHVFIISFTQKRKKTIMKKQISAIRIFLFFAQQINISNSVDFKVKITFSSHKNFPKMRKLVFDNFSKPFLL